MAWRAIYFKNHNQWDVDDGGEHDSDRFSITEDMKEEHAKLIAAAPSLLAACQAILAIHDSPMGTAYELPRVIAEARAAIAKTQAAGTVLG